MPKKNTKNQKKKVVKKQKKSKRLKAGDFVDGKGMVLPQYKTTDIKYLNTPVYKVTPATEIQAGDTPIIMTQISKNHLTGIATGVGEGLRNGARLQPLYLDYDVNTCWVYEFMPDDSTDINYRGTTGVNKTITTAKFYIVADKFANGASFNMQDFFGRAHGAGSGNDNIDISFQSPDSYARFKILLEKDIKRPELLAPTLWGQQYINGDATMGDGTVTMTSNVRDGDVMGGNQQFKGRIKIPKSLGSITFRQEDPTGGTPQNLAIWAFAVCQHMDDDPSQDPITYRIRPYYVGSFRLHYYEK